MTSMNKEKFLDTQAGHLFIAIVIGIEFLILFGLILPVWVVDLGWEWFAQWSPYIGPLIGFAGLLVVTFWGFRKNKQAMQEQWSHEDHVREVEKFKSARRNIVFALGELVLLCKAAQYMRSRIVPSLTSKNMTALAACVSIEIDRLPTTQSRIADVYAHRRPMNPELQVAMMKAADMAERVCLQLITLQSSIEAGDTNHLRNAACAEQCEIAATKALDQFRETIELLNQSAIEVSYMLEEEADIVVEQQDGSWTFLTINLEIVKHHIDGQN